MLNRTQFPQKPRSGRDCCLFWLQHIVRTHWRNQSTPSDTLGIGLEMPVWSFFFLLRKLVGILKRVTHAIIFRLLGLRKVAHGLEHLCATSMSLGSISNPEPTCQTESNPKIYKYILKCQLITCCFSQHFPFLWKSVWDQLRALWGGQHSRPCSSLQFEALHGPPSS